ncbi:hypothetical protein BC829DRAFT_44496 [Chytridium lagenaria]|nr:hypothetical protein BC829DRAFT_44496 [Chytridium lagenaria]
MVMIASALERVDTEGIGVSEASKGDDRYWAVKVAVQGDTSENMIKGRVSVTNNTGIYRNDAILAQGRRASVSRRQSVMMRSRPGSGSRANSVFRSPINRVPRERVLELWKAVRAAFLKKTPDIVNLLNNSAPIPYSLSIRQGFQFKYKLNVKHHIRCVQCTLEFHGITQKDAWTNSGGKETRRRLRVITRNRQRRTKSWMRWVQKCTKWFLIHLFALIIQGRFGYGTLRGLLH